MVSDTERILLAVMVALIMLGMGSSLTWKDFLLAIKRPWGLIIGAVSQFGFMPLIALALALGLMLHPLVAVGLLLMGTMPGGTTSNIFTYFSKGNLALSVLMTVNSSLLALVMVPIILLAYGSFFVVDGESVKIPVGDIVATITVLLVPVGIGMTVRRFNANVGALLELLGSILGIVVIIFLIVTWVPRNFQLLLETQWQVYFAAITLGLFGIFLGYLFGKLVRIHPRNCRTVALETGIQNGPLAITVVLLSFVEPEQSRVLMIPVLYSLFIVLTATLVTFYFRRVDEREEQKIPDLL